MTNQNTSDDPRPTAAMIAIGDELLSGRTHDTNIHFLAGWLNDRGVNLVEARMIADDAAVIVSTINGLRGAVDMVFTSGGIGPTHDDITADAVATAFGVEASENAEALSVLTDWYAAKGEEVTDRRKRMARTPPGAQLIKNTVSGAPGFVIENVHVMAGVPAIFQAMLNELDDVVARGPSYTAYTVQGTAKESELADGLLALETALKGLKIGSYPGKSGTSGRLSIVCKSFDPALAKQAADAVEGLFRAKGVDPTVVDGFGPSLE